MKFPLLLALGFLALAAPAQWRRVEEPQRPADKKAEQPSPAQDPDQEPVIRFDVELVNITCSVRDRNGRLIPNLTKDDFEVKEDGKAQDIKFFARETDIPLTMGLLVDVSGSQERLIEVEKEAADQFFRQVLRPKDLAFLISFGSEAELLQDLTGSAKLLRAGLEGLKVNSAVGGLHPGPVPTMNTPRGTILFDAVYLAATDRLKGQVGRKALILITDGVDQGSRVKRDEAIRVAHLNDAIIYAIHYYDASAYNRRGYTFGGGDDGDLKRMAEQTGGRVLRVGRKNTLSDVFQQIQEELRSQYSIGYTPTNAARDGGFRKLEIQTKDKDQKVQARRGYFATAASE